MSRAFLSIVIFLAAFSAEARGPARAVTLSTRGLSIELVALSQILKKEGVAAEAVAVGERSAGKYEVEGLFLKSVPADRNPASALIWNRTEAARAVMREMKEAGVPILLAELRTGLRAFVMPAGHRLGAPLLTHLHSAKQSYMVIQADSTKPELIHEFQHFKDFEDQSLSFSLDELEASLSKQRVSNEDLEILLPAIREYRGYAAQERSILADIAAGEGGADQLQLQAARNAYAIQEGAFYYVICRLRAGNASAFELLMRSLEKLALPGTGGEVALPSRASAAHYCRSILSL